MGGQGTRNGPISATAAPDGSRPGGRFGSGGGPRRTGRSSRGRGGRSGSTGRRFAIRRNWVTHFCDSPTDNSPQAISPMTQNGANGKFRSNSDSSSRSNSWIGSQPMHTGGENPHSTLPMKSKLTSGAPVNDSGNRQQKANTRKYPPARNTLMTMADMVARRVVFMCSEQNSPIQANALAYTARLTTAAGNMTG
jgi:hypothetical protein